MDLLIRVLAEYVIFLVGAAALVLAVRLGPADRRRFITLVAVGSIAALLVSFLAQHLHYEPRPFAAEHIRPLVPHGSDNGFPSDHALASMTLTACAWFFSRRMAAFMLLGTVAVGLGRILAHLHSPQQIAAGWSIAIVAVVASQYALELVYGIKAGRRSDAR